MIKKHFLFHLGHPAHFHLFKNPILSLISKNHHVSILIKRKDILESLLERSGFNFLNVLPQGRTDSKIGILWGMIKTDLKLLNYCRNNRPDLLIGTSYAISHIGKLLSIPSINVNEDDWDAVPLYSKFSYPWASVILSPSSCKNGKWEIKSIHYKGYHELAYLHPSHFIAEESIAARYIDLNKPYTILRFSSFNAHHDNGIKGISNSSAIELVNLLKRMGNVYITSERNLPDELEGFKLKINPIDIHHVMAFADLYLGDSQTMAAEAGVLGVPFIRFNDFVNKLGYLDELENYYQLGFGFKPIQEKQMFQKVKELIEVKDELKEKWNEKKKKMILEKIDVSSFLTWFIENYPESRQIMSSDPDYQYRFR